MLIREQGLEGVTLRAVGDRSGVSRTAPYRHFTDKTALLAATATRVITEMITEVAASVMAAEGHQARLRAFYTGYVAYALRHREEYRLVFAPEFIGGKHPELERAIDEVMSWLGMEGAGHAPVMALLSTAHGLAELATLGHLTHKELTPEKVIDCLVGTSPGPAVVIWPSKEP
jgi:AcrR family transcriptional regulator